jgi:hypothetical protein
MVVAMRAWKTMAMTTTSTGLIRVVLDSCISACATDLTSGCEATIVDGSIEVSAWGEYTRSGGECLAVCGELSAECGVTGLDESVTQLSYSEVSVEIDFPASGSIRTSG